jgi:predicted lysophospholipase L1 biosynthesis ABC-type transport system permease subunit
MGGDAPPWSSVVGVVGNVRHNGLTAEVKDQWYVPHAQFHRSTGFTTSAMSLVIKTSLPPAKLVKPIRDAILAYDPKLPVSDIRTLEELLTGSFSQPRFTMLLLILCSALALTLAVVGVFGVLGYSISLRRHEIGLRMALGAQSREVLAMVLRQGVALSGTGILLGAIASLVLTRFLSSLLYGVQAQDPLTFVLVVILLLIVALGASYIPARRAASIDPMAALRNE